MSLDAYNEHIKFQDLLQQLPATLQLQFQLSNLITQAHKAFVDINLFTMTLQDERTLDSAIKKLNSQIDSIEWKAVSGRYAWPQSMLEINSSSKQVTPFSSQLRGRKSMQCIFSNHPIP
jgi:hypothetical protein